MSSTVNKIKKAVLREDLLAITGDFRKAIILKQFIYWSERVSDADKFIEKENEIGSKSGLSIAAHEQEDGEEDGGDIDMQVK